MKHRFSGLSALAAIALMTAGPAFAHAKLIDSNPPANGAVKAAPKTITLTFSENLVPAFSKFELTMPEHGNMKVPVRTSVSKDGKTITGTPEGALVKGTYKIVWTAASSDGHRMNGEVAFKVG